MRIGIVLSSTPAYSETFFRSKIEGLIKNGFEVILYCQRKDGKFNLCPVVLGPKVSSNPVLLGFYFLKEYFVLLPYFNRVLKYIKLEKSDGTSFPQILKKIYLNAHLLKAKVDWLHFGFATQALGSETMAKAIGAKMAVSFRGFDINVYPIKNPGCYAKLWKHIDKVHSISNYLLLKAQHMELNENVPFAIITPAVQLDLLPKTDFDEISKPLKIVTIARLNWIKGLDLAIAAMKILKKKEIDFEYSIIGDGDQKQTERYKYMVHEFGLQNEVVFCGKMTHKDTLEELKKADIYIQPSLNEGFCNAVLEAQAMGKLCIVSNKGGLPENIVDGKTGWIFPDYCPQSLAETMERVLCLSNNEKQLISENARKRVEKEFNIEKQQQEFLNFYN
jgi:colanic acid/amylovoran biosynthesis glycosyltransferase